MSTPSVCCMLLTADRQAFTDRAVKSFLSQTYENRELLIYDSGVTPYELPELDRDSSRKVVVVRVNNRPNVRVGRLRNEAASITGSDLIAHWDSDDWSHRERLFLQVEEMATCRATGFSNILFFDSRERKEAWEYTYTDRRRVHGTSLMYWRQTWKMHPFDENKIEGEENRWPDVNGVHGTNGSISVKIVTREVNWPSTSCQQANSRYQVSRLPLLPLMIADYHGRNTSSYGKSFNTPVIFDQTPAQRIANPQFRRAHEWDAYCREVML